MARSYEDFILSKRQSLQPMGFEVPRESLNPMLFGWQGDVTHWALRRGRAALFEDCGLGKSPQSLTWGEQVVRHTNKPVMFHCPIGVRHQLIREAEKFGIGVPVLSVDSSDGVREPGIYVVNYEKLHKFDTSVFAGVVLDESGVLKNFVGKVKRQLVDAYKSTPYRLCCTATPSPNDHVELGTHAEFLGICQREDMLSKYFVHDGSDTSKWRLRGHAKEHFWEWVASWAVCLSKPSDIGGSDDGYDLPELIVNRHYVRPDVNDAVDGYLFNVSGISATNIHEEKRLTCSVRCDKVAKLLSDHQGPVVIWCDTNYEADELKKRFPDAVEVRGTDSEYKKEQSLSDFADGKFDKLITKAKIAGFGSNWQHCNRQVFAGLSYSFESYFQAVRRCYRFGQKRPVTIDVVLAETESAIQSAVASKEADHRLMQTEMAKAMRKSTLRELGIDKGKEIYDPRQTVGLPSFLGV